MSSAKMEEWDLTSHVSPYLDRHMVFPLLEYLDTLISQGSSSYSSKDVAAARLSLLRPTHMVDYAMDVYKSLHGEKAEVPEEMQKQKDSVYKELEGLRGGCEVLDKLCKDEEERVSFFQVCMIQVANLLCNDCSSHLFDYSFLFRFYCIENQTKLQASGQWNLKALASKQVTEEMVETYRLLARFNFDCGDYRAARDMLAHYISIFASPPAQAATADEDEMLATGLQHSKTTGDTDTGNPAMYYLKDVKDENMLNVLWGRLACEILVEDWPAASVAVGAVRAAMESMVTRGDMSPLQALQQRTWLLHWSLFVYWNDDGGLEDLVDIFHSERYKQAITTNAPHLVRYLTAAVLLCKRRVTKKAAAGSNAEARRLYKNLITVLQDVEYTDPIVEFVKSLTVKFDFETAQTKLTECEAVLKADFFLCQQTDLFMEEARVFVFENYCRIHNKIDLKAVAEKLAMTPEQAEKWIVDLIRNADLDAKIDGGAVVMGVSTQTVYEQVMDRTRDLNVRSATLAQNLSNLLQDARKEKAKKERAAREDI